MLSFLFSFLLSTLVQVFLFSLSSVCSFCVFHSFSFRLTPILSKSGTVLRLKRPKKYCMLCFKHYSSHNIACSWMRQPCSALQWWVRAQGRRGSTWWWSRWPNWTSWGLKTTTIWPSDDNNNLSVTLPSLCGWDIREKLSLRFPGLYSLSLIVYLLFDRLMQYSADRDHSVANVFISLHLKYSMAIDRLV